MEPSPGGAMSAGAKRVMSEGENREPEILPASVERTADRGHRDRGRRRHRNTPRHLEASINMNELRELIGLITDNGLTQFELEREGFRVKIGRGPIISEQAASALAAATERQIMAGAAHAPAPV